MIIGAAVTGLPVAVVATRDVLIVALTRLLGLPHLSRTTLDRQIVLALAQLLALLVLLLLNLTLLIDLLLVDLLLLLTLDLALLILLLLDLTLLIILFLEALVLLLTLLPVFARAVVQLIARRIITFVGQCLSADAQTQQTYTRKLPDARFHAFLTRARVDVIKTV
ncbi:MULTISPECIES: hypothetical protein [Pseudomonas syringae group]|uniref:hypothetical protein n=1 Tax=Pseudomonas syringae group TaxID=136849 RepID=UPI00287B9E8A|nr:MULTISPECIES: hypothetical protein [Pseudomonas syringae group]